MSTPQRLPNAQYLNIEDIVNLSVNNTVEGIEGTVAKVDKPYAGQDFTFQIITISQGRSSIQCQVWNREDLSYLRGRSVAIECSLGKNDSAIGVVTDEYKGAIRLKIKETAIIDDLSSSNPPQQQPHNATRTPPRPSQGNAGQQRPAAPQRGQQQPQRTPQRPQQYRQPAKGPINGQTVGMAINQAIGVIKGVYTTPQTLSNLIETPEFSRQLHALASDIIRVSMLLESGGLAEPIKKRSGSESRPIEAEAEPEPEQVQPEPDPEPQYHHQEDQGFTDGLADDEIPF